MASGESLSLRELLDDPLSDQWAKNSHSGLKLDELFVLSNVVSDKSVMHFEIKSNRFERGRNDRVGRTGNG